MNKLYVAGCSFTDNLPIPHNYGSKLATLLGLEYVHKARGIGSNHRMWRHLTNAIMDKQLTSDDLLVVQYTNPERREFWSAIPRSKEELHADCSEYYDEDGTILKFKMDSYYWQNNKIEKDFMKMYEENFLSIKFEQEVFNYQNFMFQSMLLQHKIPTVFLYSRYNNNFYVNNEYKPHIFYEPKSFIDDESTYMDVINDRYHLNERGHTRLADMLHEHIKSFPSGILI
jgi:hypothetical protein